MCTFSSSYQLTFAKGNKQLVLLGPVPELNEGNCGQQDSKSHHSWTQFLSSAFCLAVLIRISQ